MRPASDPQALQAWPAQGSTTGINIDFWDRLSLNVHRHEAPHEVGVEARKWWAVRRNR